MAPDETGLAMCFAEIKPKKYCIENGLLYWSAAQSCKFLLIELFIWFRPWETCSNLGKGIHSLECWGGVVLLRCFV